MKIVIDQLRPVVIRIIRQTVRTSGLDNIGNINTLVQTISTQLRPVVFNEVERALKTSTKYQNILNANDLTQRIVVELRPFITQGVREQVEVLKKENEIDPEEIINRIITQLEPIVINVIRTTVRNSNVDLSDTQGLVNTIVTQLRPVVFREVQTAIDSAGATSLNADQLTTQIVRRLRPFVVTGVQREIQVIRQSQTSSNDLVSSVISQLQPFIVDTVSTVLGGSGKIEKATADQASVTFLAKLRPIIRQIIVRIMTTSGAGISDENILIQQVNGQIEDGTLLRLIQEEVRAALGSSVTTLPPQSEFELLLEELRPRIRLMIIEEIRLYRQQNELNPEAQARIVSAVIANLRLVVEQATALALQSSGSGSSDDQIITQLTAQLRPQVIQTLEQEVSGTQVFQSGSFANSDAFNQLMAAIMRQIRTIIIQQIRIYRAEQARLAAATVRPATGGNKVTAIFGTGGQNKVRVETPIFNYGYEFDRK